MPIKKVKVFLGGALLAALVAATVTPFLGIGVAATAVDLAASVAGGLFAVSQT